MGQEVCNTAQLSCTFSATPSALTVLPVNRVLTVGQPAANIEDSKPMVNIMPFGACMSPSNPVVAAATAKNLGVLNPMPCIPVTVAPWTARQPC